MFKNYLPMLLMLLPVINMHNAALKPEVVSFYNNVTPGNVNKAVVFRVSKLICSYKEVLDNPNLQERDKVAQLTAIATQIDQIVTEYLVIYWYQYESTDLSNKNLGGIEEIGKLIWIRQQCRKLLALQLETQDEDGVSLTSLLENVEL